MFVNVARSRFLLITGLYLALTSGCGRLAYETLLPLRTDQDAGALESDEPIPVDDGGSTVSPASSPSTTTPHDSTATDALDRASSGSDGHTSDSTSYFTSHSTSGATTTPLSSVVSTDDAASETPNQSVGDLSTTDTTLSQDTAPNGTGFDATSSVSELSSGTSTAASTTSEVGDSDSPSTSDTATSDTAVYDSATSAATDSTTPCVAPGAFLPPIAVTGLPVPAFSPSLSADRLTLYFASGGEIFTAERSSVDSLDFTGVTAVAAVNSGNNELTPQLSRDGLRLYFARGNDPMRDIYVATRATTADGFGSPTAVAPVNTPYFNEMLPRESPNGHELFFTSLRGANFFDIWVARRNDVAEAYGAPTVVVELTTSSDENPGGLSSDGRMMVMTSKRTGTLGGQDIWTTSRATTADAFGTVTNEAVLNTTFNELDPTLSADDLELMFGSDRDGNALIYSALRECSP
jgi:Tol biopolymer transport system component